MSWYRNFLAVTGACLMIRRDRFDEVGGFDERFIVCGSDVAFGLRVNSRGKRVVYTPFARLIHHESATRDPQKFPDSDSWMSFEVYRPWLESGDPFYNPGLSLDVADGRLRLDERRPVELAAGALALLASRGRQPAKLVHERRVIMGFVGELDPARHQSAGRIRHAGKSAQLERMTWLVPYFHHPYGGIHTILRFADVLRSKHGVQSEFVVFDKPDATPGELQARVRPLYPEPPGEFRVLASSREMEALEPTDVVLATFWTSAYFALRHPQARLGAYFVQDFEPLFYPAGTMYALAEQTYRLGLFGVFNSPGLGEFVEGHYGMKGVSFEPAVDPTVFHDQRPVRSGPVRVFFYGRPSADRNGFELGVTALRRLKERLGDRVEILSAGEAWSAGDFGVEGVIRNVGVLPYEATADLYRSCDVGLCFMFTKHPSYLPLELMASGVCVVTNDNPANRWLLRNGENCLLADPVASSVLEQLVRACSDGGLRARLASTAAERMRRRTWEQAIETVHRALTARLSMDAGRPQAPLDRAAEAV
jgi:glycosyltransferase involved in cell wall biosynthesis